jgi:hypothetical protein
LLTILGGVGRFKLLLSLTSLIAAVTFQVVVLALTIGAAVGILAKNLATTLMAAGSCGIVVAFLGSLGSNVQWVHDSFEKDFTSILFPAVVTVFAALVTRLLIVVVGSGRS